MRERSKKWRRSRFSLSRRAEVPRRIRPLKCISCLSCLAAGDDARAVGLSLSSSSNPLAQRRAWRRGAGARPHTLAASRSPRFLSIWAMAPGSAPNSARCPSMVLIGRNSASGMSRHSRLAIRRREEHVRRHRHNERLGFDSAQRRPQIAAGVAADVAALPFPRHAQQIVRIHHAEIAVHEVDDEIIERRKAQRLVPVLLEELRAPAHHRPHLGVPQQAFAHIRRRCVEALVEAGVGGDRVDQGFGEEEIVDGVSSPCRRSARRASPCRDSARPIHRSAARPWSRRPPARGSSGRTSRSPACAARARRRRCAHAGNSPSRPAPACCAARWKARCRSD